MSEPPEWSERLRLSFLRVDRPAVLGLAAIAVVALLVAGLLAWNSRARTVTYAGDGSVPGAAAAVASVPGSAPPVVAGSAASTGGSVVVDVVGRVRRPGLVTVPAGSRVADVVRAAGGFRKASDARSVNQARVVVDGEQVVVGGGPGAVAGPAIPGGAPAEAAPVDLNTATLEQLETLPGVGPVLAQRILEHRATSGGFRSVDELRDVSGIGDKTFADLAPRVRV